MATLRNVDGEIIAVTSSRPSFSERQKAWESLVSSIPDQIESQAQRLEMDDPFRYRHMPITTPEKPAGILERLKGVRIPFTRRRD